MNTIFHIYIIGIILLIIGGIIYLFLRHQRNLKSRAFLMQEAIRNGDYSFRLSTKGLLSGERALQIQRQYNVKSHATFKMIIKRA